MQTYSTNIFLALSCFCGILLTFYQLFSAPPCLFSVVANQVNHNKTPLGPPRHMPVQTYIQTLIHSTNQLFKFDFPDKNIVFPSVQQTMRYRYCWYLSHTPTSYGWVVMFLLSFVCAKNKNVVRYNIISPLIIMSIQSIKAHVLSFTTCQWCKDLI